jgi:hypothetical protein
MRWVFRVAIVVALLYGALLGLVYMQMMKPPLEFAGFWGDVPAFARRVVPFRPLWNRARAGSLQPGDAAPDFELPYHDHSGAMRLSELRGRPVVLVFGSYT